MSHVVDFSTVNCHWCGMSSNDARVIECPACSRFTCMECVRLYDEGTYCEHTTPKERGVLTKQDWSDHA